MLSEQVKAELDESGTSLEEVFEYLDDLRDSGETNMYGAGVYLKYAFDFKRSTCNKILGEWMDTFSERHA